MERIENIHQVQSSKVQKSRSNVNGCGSLDEETIDFQIDDSVRLARWILCYFSSAQCQDKKSSVLDYFQHFRKDYPID